MHDDERLGQERPELAHGVPIMAKLAPPPPRAGLVARERGAALLDQGLRDGHRLLLISAPAGAGKSTLVATWLRTRGLRPAWLTLDAADNDPQRFFAYLIAALQQVAPQIGTATRSLLGGPGLPLPEALVGPLLLDLATLAEPLLLVLDDYHLIEASIIHDVLALLVERQPPGLRLALVTRADPPLPLPRLRARGQLTEVRVADLRFTLDETTAFFRQTMPLPLDEPALRTLNDHTEGWAAGLQLAALSLRERDAHECAAFVRRFGASSQFVIDYLVDEVLARQPPHRKAFLLHTAILDRLCGPLCDAVLGLEASDAQPETVDPLRDAAALPLQASHRSSYSQHVLAELERANLFLVPLDPERRWYRYHQLFAEALRAQLDADPAAVATLHRRAARWLAAQGLWEDAVRHARAGGDLALTAQLVERAADGLLRRGEAQSLHAWLEGLPGAALNAHPALATLLAWTSYLTGRLEQSGRLRARLTATPPEQLDRRSRGRLLVLEALQSNADESSATVDLATAALDLLGDDDIFRQIGLLTLGHGLRRLGATRAASDTYRSALEPGRLPAAPFVTVNLLNSLAVNLNEEGRRPEALERCAAARRELSDRDGRPLPILDLLAIAECVLAYEGNRLEIARDHAEHGWDAVRHWRLERIAGLDTERVAVLASLGLGDIDAARARIAAARAVPSSLQWFRPGVDALEAELWLRVGEVAATRRWAAAAGPSVGGAPDGMREYASLTFARLLLAEGRLVEAEVLLARLEAAMRAGQRLARLVTVRLLQALAAARRGDEPPAMAALAEAVALAAPGGYLRRFLDEGPQVAALLRAYAGAPEADESPMRRGFVAQALAALEPAAAAPPAPSAVAAPPLPEPLSDQELVVLRLLNEGRSNQEIAARLVITVGTAKWHVHNLYAKLGVSGRLPAVNRARELRLLDPS